MPTHSRRRGDQLTLRVERAPAGREPNPLTTKGPSHPELPDLRATDDRSGSGPNTRRCPSNGRRGWSALWPDVNQPHLAERRSSRTLKQKVAIEPFGRTLALAAVRATPDHRVEGAYACLDRPLGVLR